MVELKWGAGGREGDQGDSIEWKIFGIPLRCSKLKFSNLFQKSIDE